MLKRVARPSSCAALGQGGQAVVQDVDAGEQVFAEAAGGGFAAQVAVGAGDELEAAFAFAVAADGVEAFFFDGFEQHGLFVQAEFADFVEKEQAAVGGFEIAFAFFGGAGEGAFFVAKESGGGAVAAQGGAVDIDKAA